jgi:thiamine-monophosphate kinase
MFDKRDKSKSDKKPGLTPLSEVGEFGLIDRLTKDLPAFHKDTVKGVGDDAAVIDTGDKFLLLSTDLLAEGIHFNLAYMPLKHLGYKAVVANVSDIAAMNGIPKQITVSLALSSRFTLEAVEELYSGIRAACEKYGVDLVGGDTTSSRSGLVISISITGEVEKEKVVYRSGAKPGDLLCVTGDLGSAYLGLLVLERENKVFEVNPAMQPELAGYEYQVGKQLKPEARTDIRMLLEEGGIRPTAMIDISDGLASEALHLCKQSGTGCRIYEDKIPVDDETVRIAKEEFKIVPSVCALSGGEEYELLFTIPASDYEKIKGINAVSVIGHMTDASEGNWLIAPDGVRIRLTAQGWDGLRQ